MRICIYSKYEYPNIKSRLKLLLAKILQVDKGFIWKRLCNFIIGKDNKFTYYFEIMKEEFTDRIEILILKEDFR